MSSKRVKREVVNADPPNSSHSSSAPGETDRLRKEVNHKNEVIDTLEDFVHKIQKGLCCEVCTELLYQPFHLACGHVFCYSCLVDWFKEAKRCPTCRQRVVDKPSVSYLIKEIVTSFVRRAEVVDPEGTGARFNKEQRDADKAVREHNGDLFPGLFRSQHPPNRIPDQDDGVLRCIRCHWEVEGPTCMHCGLEFSDNEGFDFGDFGDDDEDDEGEDESDDDGEEEEEDDDDEEGEDEDDENVEFYGFVDDELGIPTYLSDEESETDSEEEEEDEDDSPTGHVWDDEAEDDEAEDDEEDSDEEDEEDEDGSFVDSRDEYGVYTDEMSVDDSEEDSIPYHVFEDSYYNTLDSSTDYDHYNEEDDDDGDDEEEEDSPGLSRHHGEDSESDSDDTIRGTSSGSSHSRRSSHVVFSDEE